MSKGNGDFIRLLESSDTQLISDRFRVKISTFDNGVDKKSTMMVIHDILKNHFKITFYNTCEEAAQIINLLRRVRD